MQELWFAATGDPELKKLRDLKEEEVPMDEVGIATALGDGEGAQGGLYLLKDEKKGRLFRVVTDPRFGIEVVST